MQAQESGVAGVQESGGQELSLGPGGGGTRPSIFDSRHAFRAFRKWLFLDPLEESSLLLFGCRRASPATPELLQLLTPGLYGATAQISTARF